MTTRNVAPTPSSRNARSKKRRWFAFFGGNSLLLSILIHVFFGVGATYLIVEVFQKKHVQFIPPAPSGDHNEVEHKVQLQKKNNVDSAPPDLKRIVTTAISPITLPEPPETPLTDVANPSPISGLDGQMGLGMGGGGHGGGGGGGQPPFGAANGSGLEGYFYDFKQTKARKPTGMGATGDQPYLQLLSKYVAGGWNDEMFAPYYKSKDPLYSSVFAISTRPSEAAPAAFGLEKEVSAGLWIVHYRGKVSAPDTANYRLLGFGDNILVVKIRGVTILDGGWDPLTKNPKLHEPLPYAIPSYAKDVQLRGSLHDPHLKAGPFFHLIKDVPVDIEVLIGDCGGVCSFFIMVDKEGSIYSNEGGTAYPFLQIGTTDTPTFSNAEEHPPFTSSSEPWQNADY